MKFGDHPAGLGAPTIELRGQVVDATADRYHQDDLGTDTPTLSASVAKLLIDQSPAHAKAAHPKLNPEYIRKDEGKFDIGTVAHALILQGLELADIHHYDAWRSNDAKEARDLSRQHGRIPLLKNQHDEVMRMVDAVQTQLDRFNLVPRPFTDGKPEVCITFEQQGVPCRSLIDWLTTDCATVVDLKTTSASAHPQAWCKTALGMGADVQVAFHTAAVEATFGVRPRWLYVVVETYPPYALSIVEPDAEFLALGRDKMQAALTIWQRCLAADVWPGYPMVPVPLSAPGWASSQWMEREASL